MAVGTAARRDALPTAALADRVPAAVVACVAPILLTSGLIAVYVAATGGGGDPPRWVVDAAYGVAALAVFAAVARVLDGREWAAAVRFERPGRWELLGVVVGVPLGVVGYLAGSTLGELLGFSMQGAGYSLGDPLTLAAVVFGGVLVAPFVEEVLFRGLLLGGLLGRGLSPVVAGALSVGLFAAVHVVALGPGGVLAIAGWAVVPTALRLRFENLTGAYLAHLCNNVWAYIIVVALGVA